MVTCYNDMNIFFNRNQKKKIKKCRCIIRANQYRRLIYNITFLIRTISCFRLTGHQTKHEDTKKWQFVVFGLFAWRREMYGKNTTHFERCVLALYLSCLCVRRDERPKTRQRLFLAYFCIFDFSPFRPASQKPVTVVSWFGGAKILKVENMKTRQSLRLSCIRIFAPPH